MTDTEIMPSAPSDVEVREQAAPTTVQYTRLLASAFKKSSMEPRDGGLLVRDVPMLAAGTWTDSAVQTALNYPERTLKEYAANWSDNTGWVRHTGGFPRDATDKVAELLNPRFQDGAVVGDIFLHGATQKSRDMIELVKRKLIAMVSVEHTGDERYNSATRQLEATTINFSGFAFVNKGACKLCRINEEAPAASVPTIEAPVAVPEEREMSELEELKAQVAELTRKLSEPKPEAIKVAEPVVVDNSRELEEAAAKEQAAQALKQVAELQAQVKELMSRPAEAVAVAALAPVKEMKEPEFTARIDRKNRFVEVL